MKNWIHWKHVDRGDDGESSYADLMVGSDAGEKSQPSIEGMTGEGDRSSCGAVETAGGTATESGLKGRSAEALSELKAKEHRGSSQPRWSTQSRIN